MPYEQMGLVKASVCALPDARLRADALSVLDPWLLTGAAGLLWLSNALPTGNAGNELAVLNESASQNIAATICPGSACEARLRTCLRKSGLPSCPTVFSGCEVLQRQQ